MNNIVITEASEIKLNLQNHRLFLSEGFSREEKENKPQGLGKVSTLMMPLKQTLIFSCGLQLCLTYSSFKEKRYSR